MFKEIVANALLAAVALYGSAVQAKDQQIIAEGRMPHTASRTISYADLNLADDGQADILKVRVRKAARQVCHEVYRNQPVNLLWAEYYCIRNARLQASFQIGRAVAQARSGATVVKMAEVQVSAIKR